VALCVSSSPYYSEITPGASDSKIKNIGDENAIMDK
jgi:hypothetical protein